MALALDWSGISAVAVGVQEAGSKIKAAAHEVVTRDSGNSWLQRVIHREIAARGGTRGAKYWDELFPGLAPEARAEARIRRMLVRATAAGTLAAAGATTAELWPLMSDGVVLPLALPIGLVSVGAEMLYTTALQIDLAVDLASIYGVPFAADDVGAISTLLAAALGVDLVSEPSSEQATPAAADRKPWRVLREMERDDFAQHVGSALLEQAVVRNLLPVIGVVVSAAWNQIVLRRFARHVHTAIRHRLGIVCACRGVTFRDLRTAHFILDGAFLIATADGDMVHQEALALATLIDSLSQPDRAAVQDASFEDDAEGWFAELPSLEPEAHDKLIQVLVLVAGASGKLGRPERRFLERLARVLNRKLDFAAIERLMAQMRQGAEHQPLAHFEFAT